MRHTLNKNHETRTRIMLFTLIQAIKEDKRLTLSIKGVPLEEDTSKMNLVSYILSPEEWSVRY